MCLLACDYILEQFIILTQQKEKNSTAIRNSRYFNILISFLRIFLTFFKNKLVAWIISIKKIFIQQGGRLSSKNRLAWKPWTNQKMKNVQYLVNCLVYNWQSGWSPRHQWQSPRARAQWWSEMLFSNSYRSNVVTWCRWFVFSCHECVMDIKLYIFQKT